MTKKKRNKVKPTMNSKDLNGSFATLIKFIDQMDDKQVDKWF